jgi:hypothetical protein
MDKLSYGTGQFDVPEFERRKVIDEIKMVISAYDCVVPDGAAIYCSSDITTGKRFYYDVLKPRGVHSEEDLRRKVGAEEFKNIQTALIQDNVVRGVAFAEKLRERGLINVVSPGPFFARGFDQQHYLYLWELFIIKKVYQIRFNYDWEYSNGCSFEYVIAAKKGIPRLDREGGPLSLSEAIARVNTAAEELKSEGFIVTKLEANLKLMKELED